MPAPQLTFNGNNQIVGASYDASGDLLEDSAGNTYTYNARRRTASADSDNIQYVYNAFGQRVEKIVGGVAKYYLYDPAGHAVTVLDQNGDWIRGEIFAGSRHIATYLDGTSGTTYFDYSDWLGTERLTATVNGCEQDACTSLPFGDGLNCTGPGADPSPLHFTGRQHDNETGLDHFPARNYTSAWGRWMAPDWSASPAAVPYATFSDPQSLDLYAYALDNPETNTDPDGHRCFLGIGTSCGSKAKAGPKPAGPGWITRCEGNSICEKAILAGLVQAALAVNQARQQAQAFKRHPYLSGALFGLSLFVGPEAEEAGDAAEAGLGEGANEGVGVPWVNITEKGAAEVNLKVGLTPEEFGRELEADGYARSEDGDVVHYDKGERRYTVYTARSTKSPSALLNIAGRRAIKIRLQR